MNVENQETTWDRYENDHRLEVDSSVYETAQPMNSEPDETSYNKQYKNDWKQKIRHQKDFLVAVGSLIEDLKKFQKSLILMYHFWIKPGIRTCP